VEHERGVCTHAPGWSVINISVWSDAGSFSSQRLTPLSVLSHAEISCDHKITERYFVRTEPLILSIGTTLLAARPLVDHRSRMILPAVAQAIIRS
jgi:hypothetical protein